MIPRVSLCFPTAFALCIATAPLSDAAEVARWSMNEGTGFQAASSIGSPGADALFINDPQWVSSLLAPVPGNTAAIELHPDTVYLQSNTLQGVTGSAARTFSAWVRLTDRIDWEPIVDYGADSNGNVFSIIKNSGHANTVGTHGAIRVGIGGGHAVGNIPIDDFQWHHVAVTLPEEGSVDDVRIYIDGVLDADISNFSSVADAPIDTSESLINFGERINGSQSFLGVIDEVRYWDEELSAGEVAALVPGGPLPTIHFEVDRSTGNISLQNGYGTPIDQIVGYSIRSELGTLDVEEWLSVADNYDSDSGTPSFDANSTWTILTDTEEPTGEDLSEFAPEGSGGVLSTSTPLNLGEAWMQLPMEDLTAELIFDNGDRLPIAVEYTGDPIEFADLDGNGEVDGLDWGIFRSHLLSNLSEFSPAEAYLRGDLDFDGDNDRDDFDLFEAAYDTANGAGTFVALSSSTAVPEPASVALLAPALLLLCKRGRAKALALRGVLPLMLLALVCCGPRAHADVLAYYDFESPSPYADKSLNGADGTVSGSTAVTTAQGVAPDFGTGNLSVSLWYRGIQADGNPDGLFDMISGSDEGLHVFRSAQRLCKCPRGC